MKVLIVNLFHKQRVVGVPAEPCHLCSGRAGAFFVADELGVVRRYYAAAADVTAAQQEQEVVCRSVSGARSIRKMAYVDACECLLLWEKECAHSSLYVVRLYPINQGAQQQVVISCPSSTTSFAVCENNSARFVVASSTVSVYQCNSASNVELIYSFTLMTPASSVALYGNCVATCEDNLVTVMQIEVERTSQREDSSVEKLLLNTGAQDVSQFVDRSGAIDVEQCGYVCGPEEQQEKATLGPIPDVDSGLLCEEDWHLTSSTVLLRHKFVPEDNVRSLSFLSSTDSYARFLVATEDKAHLYSFSKERCIDVAHYPFRGTTAAALTTDSFLIALNESTGMDLYTLRNVSSTSKVEEEEEEEKEEGWTLIESFKNKLPGPMMLGHLPLRGLQQLICVAVGSQQRFVTLSKVGESWNVYCLTVKSTVDLWKKLMKRSMSFEDHDSLQFHLVLEAHLLLSAALTRVKNHLQKITDEQLQPSHGEIEATPRNARDQSCSLKRTLSSSALTVTKARPFSRKNSLPFLTDALLQSEMTKLEVLSSLFRQSCHRLAQHYFASQRYCQAAKYWALSDSPKLSIVKIFLTVSNAKANHALIEYLDHVVFDVNQRNAFDDVQLGNIIIEHYARYRHERLAGVILDSYSQCFDASVALRVLLSRQEHLKSARERFCCLLLYLRVGDVNAAGSVLRFLKNEAVDFIDRELILEEKGFAELLRDEAPFSLLEALVTLDISIDLSISILFKEAEQDLSNVLVCTLLEARIAESRCSRLLLKKYAQIVVEQRHYSMYDCMEDVKEYDTIRFSSTTEKHVPFAMKWKLFHKKSMATIPSRPDWLNELPPFSSESAILSHHDGYYQHLYLMKLQGLISSLTESFPATQFLSFTSDDDEILDSLRILVWPLQNRFNEALALLLDKYVDTRATLQFCVQWAGVKNNIFAAVLNRVGSDSKLYRLLMERVAGKLNPSNFLAMLPEKEDAATLIPFIRKSFRHYQISESRQAFENGQQSRV